MCVGDVTPQATSSAQPWHQGGVPLWWPPSSCGLTLQAQSSLPPGKACTNTSSYWLHDCMRLAGVFMGSCIGHLRAAQRLAGGCASCRRLVAFEGSGDAVTQLAAEPWLVTPVHLCNCKHAACGCGLVLCSQFCGCKCLCGRLT